ncbi:MAG: efflux RND transporter periplasmic adaptor subunit [Nitrospiraceae bacterium]|nr:efflux RND transporter periplasmic adaptor subunit [Nitrospiraceae bacterium]
MSKKTKIIIAAISAGVIGIAVTSTLAVKHIFATDPKKAARAHAPMPVVLDRVSVMEINDVIGAGGQTCQLEKVTMSARLDQVVLSVNVKIGDRIREKQPLAVFDRRLIKATADQCRDNVTRTKTSLEYSRLAYQRLVNLYRQSLIPKVEIEKADAKVKESEYEYSTAVREFEKARQDMDLTVVKSPVAGIVLERSINPGEIPRLGAPLFTLGVIDDIYIMARVPENRIAYTQLNQKVEVVFDAFPNEVFKGEITKMDPNTDPKTRTFVAFVKIPNHQMRLTPGLTGFVRIRNYKKALAAPTVSIINPVGESATVFVVGPDSTAHIRAVKTGVSSDGLTEIVEGLKEGDRVVTAGLEFLKDGDKVRIMKENGKSKQS